MPKSKPTPPPRIRSVKPQVQSLKVQRRFLPPASFDHAGFLSDADNGEYQLANAQVRMNSATGPVLAAISNPTTKTWYMVPYAGAAAAPMILTLTGQLRSPSGTLVPIQSVNLNTTQGYFSSAYVILTRRPDPGMNQQYYRVRFSGQVVYNNAYAPSKNIYVEVVIS